MILFLSLSLASSLAASQTHLAAGSSAQAVNLTESLVIDLAKERTPQRIQIGLETKGKRLALSGNSLKYQSLLSATAGYGHSAEEPQIQFSPTLSPTNQLELKYQKNSQHGVAYSAAVFGSQLSTPDGQFNNETQGGYRFGIQVDLLSDIGGSRSRSEVLALAKDLEKSQFQEQLNLHRYEFQMRKLYWNLVANRESYKITRSLLKTSQKQLDELKGRKSSGLASDGDVARSQAQVESRKTSLLLLDHQQNVMINTLRQMLPQLSEKKVSIPRPSYPATYKKVMACFQKIRGQEQIQTEWSSFHQVLQSLDEKHRAESRRIEKTGGTQLQFMGSVQKSNVDKNYGDAFSKDLKTGYQVGLGLTIPLGSADRDTRESEAAINTDSYDTERRQILTTIQTRHRQAQKSLQLLMAGLNSVVETNRLLGKSVKDMQKKYKQARIDLPLLIREQEAHFSSSIQEIDIRLQVILALLEYFETFDLFPCDINHIQASQVNQEIAS